MSIDFENISIGGRLKVVRQENGLSQSSFAQALSVSLQAYQNYERGDRPVTKELIVALMSEFKVDPTWLISGVFADAQTSKSDLDERLLIQVIEGIEKLLDAKRKNLGAEKKAKIIAMLYKAALTDNEGLVNNMRQLIDIAS